MATLKELMGDKTRGDGRKFRLTFWEADEYFEPIFKDCDGDWYGIDHLKRFNSTYDFQYDRSELDTEVSWEEWTTPKVEFYAEVGLYGSPFKSILKFGKKKVKLYSPVCRNSEGHLVMASLYGCEKYKKDFKEANCVGWHEIEVEVSE